MNTRFAFTVLSGFLIVACCTHQPPSKPAEPNVVAQVASEPAAAEVSLSGKPVGPAPLTLSLGSVDELLQISAVQEQKQPVETRIRFISPVAAEVVFVFDPSRSAMAKALGLARIIVFDYGAGLTFDVDKSDLKPEFLPMLQKQADMLQKHFSGIPVYVCGHTDNTGREDHNLQLSLERAQVVNDYLVGQSVPKDLLKTQGFGSVYPVDTNETPEGRARNRRTEVILPQ